MSKERFTPFILYTERISKNIKRIEDIVMKEYGLRSSHVLCLVQLAKSSEGLNCSEISEYCGVDKAFASRITNELINKRYIKKAYNGNTGKYKVKYIFTSDGKILYEKIENTISNALKEVDKVISDEKLKTFYEVLFLLDSSIENVLKKEKNNG